MMFAYQGMAMNVLASNYWFRIVFKKKLLLNYKFWTANII